MRILIDTNVVLDVLLNREPWVQQSSGVWKAVDSGQLSGYVPASAITDIFYVARRLTDTEKARQAVSICLEAFNVVGVDREILEQALLLSSSDYEDNVILACAINKDLDAIVTRNRKDFPESPVRIMTPSDCVDCLE